jgi:hypothetical protein
MTVPSTQIITGQEPPSAESGPRDALIAFYRAFNARDLVSMEANWAPGDAPSMDNPIGGIRRGWAEIRQGYERLFRGSVQVNVEFYDFTQQQGADWALFVGRERGLCRSGESQLTLAIRTTRWFVLLDGRWRQLHHHGSVEDPALLREYQQLVFGSAAKSS